MIARVTRSTLGLVLLVLCGCGPQHDGRQPAESARPNDGRVIEVTAGGPLPPTPTVGVADTLPDDPPLDSRPALAPAAPPSPTGRSRAPRAALATPVPRPPSTPILKAMATPWPTAAPTSTARPAAASSPTPAVPAATEPTMPVGQGR